MHSLDKKGMERYLRSRGQAGRTLPASVLVTDSASLKLHSLQGSAQVTAMRVRTVLDFIFHNPQPGRLEGTFEYPLPRGASPLYVGIFAVAAGTRHNPPQRFDWRTRLRLTDARRAALAPADLARAVNAEHWEKLLEGRAPDQPAAAPTQRKARPKEATFCAGPFPIAAGGYCRVLLGFEEPFAVVDGVLQYRLPLPEGGYDKQFTLRYPVMTCVNASLFPEGARRADDSQDSCTFTWSDLPAGGEIRLRFKSAFAGGRFIQPNPD
jgi:hypothetical protein